MSHSNAHPESGHMQGPPRPLHRKRLSVDSADSPEFSPEENSKRRRLSLNDSHEPLPSLPQPHASTQPSQDYLRNRRLSLPVIPPAHADSGYDFDPSNPHQPYARTPELKVSHKLAERKRRQEMKELFDELRDVLPLDKSLKTSKWEILAKGIYI
jgi:hypothetical protein